MAHGVARCERDARRADANAFVVAIFRVLALPAWAIGGIVDRRKLILYCEYSLRPSVAGTQSDRSIVYGILLGCFGIGAVGALAILAALEQNDTKVSSMLSSNRSPPAAEGESAV